VKRRALLLLPLLAGLVAFHVLGSQTPRDQTVELVLGASAPLVEDVELRYAAPGAPDAERDRVASFHFARGSAPRVVHHEPRLPDGPCELTVELSSGGQSTSVRRTLELRAGGSTSVDLSEPAAVLSASARGPR
jgi:hypothetical protein